MGSQETPILERPRPRNPLLDLYVSGCSSLFRLLRPLITEEIQVTGLEHVVQDGRLLYGPNLWMFKHEDVRDLFNVASLRSQFGRPMIKAPSRRNYFSSKLLSEFARLAMSPLMYEMHRTWLGEGSSDEERQLMQTENRVALGKMRDDLDKGFHIMLAPEGTTRSDGHITTTGVRPGAYTFTSVPREDGTRDLVRCIAMGLTYDLMSGDKPKKRRRDVVFPNIGEPYLHEGVSREPGEADDDYFKRDSRAFVEDLTKRFIALSTITASQLAGEYLMGLPDGESVSASRLEELVESRVGALRDVDQLFIDQALLHHEGVQRRVGHLYDCLTEKGYLVDGKLDAQRTHLVPEERDYKKSNPLLYTVNRLQDMREQRPEIADVLAKVR